ncbi:Mitochondrial peptide methionine sulfoxide reductase [Nibea albiflora]|uniref:Mitochondrial peptide methionine sulfoxide reductase n=1 Tax=Nibea albiflora TaxID=240163 RepID=A0ACB7FGJ7_NIBAL|nr:Mitochondrial peptide methionine sulfoxide reductase [Nibea albiflora]
MAAYRKIVPLSQTQTLHIVWLLLLSVSLAAADSMANKNELPSRDRALKGREEKMVVAGGVILAEWGVGAGLAGGNAGLGTVKGASLAPPGPLPDAPWEKYPQQRLVYKHAVNGNPTVEPFPEGMETIMFGMGCFWGAEKHFWRLPGVFSTQVGFAGGFTPNPTYEEVCSGMKQHADCGTQYRSAIYTSNPAQRELALKSKVAYQQELDKKGYGAITTEIQEGHQFYYAEDYHQQYLKKVPKGYCGLKGTGVSCPIGAGKDEL